MNWVYPLFSFWQRVGAYAFFRIRVSGRENIPKAGAFILAGNHVSWVDPLIFLAFAHPREVHYMAKEELFSKFFLSWWLPEMHAFPVRRDGTARAALHDALHVLQGGNCLGIFPEGGRNPEGDHVVRQGGAWLAARADAPVVPCAIAGSAGEKIFRSQIKVAFGKPLYLPAGKATKADLANFTDAIMGAIDALYGEIGGNSQG